MKLIGFTPDRVARGWSGRESRPLAAGGEKAGGVAAIKIASDRLWCTKCPRYRSLPLSSKALYAPRTRSEHRRKRPLACAVVLPSLQHSRLASEKRGASFAVDGLIIARLLPGAEKMAGTVAPSRWLRWLARPRSTILCPFPRRLRALCIKIALYQQLAAMMSLISVFTWADGRLNWKRWRVSRSRTFYSFLCSLVIRIF